ncbi:MAG: MgtC/SapB family protein [Oribacterium sp.]|nr:MgtC/SapB family protein [Oribacterium sp.]
MVNFFNNLRDLTFASIALRMLLSVVCGGLVGLEREYKRRSAGFRTHILICLGASMTTLTGQYLGLYMHYYTDMARLGSQVIAGIGFIGAGTIITTQQHQVKGLTTAAGLWVSAIIGLAFGAGFFEGGLITTVLVLIAEIYLSHLEFWIRANAPDITLFIQYDNASTFNKIIQYLHEHDLSVLNTEITRQESPEGEESKMCAILSVALNRANPVSRVVHEINQITGVGSVEEL